MRIFLGGVATETNTFAPLPTGRAAFRQADDLAAMARSLIEQAGCEVAESAVLFAQPSGTTLKGAYEEMRDGLLEDLRKAGPVDAVLLLLHGAMVAWDYDDCEGDLLGRVREIVGPGVPVGAMLDPHCHMTVAMIEAADVLICMKEYPHVDGEARAAEVLDILIRTAAGEIRPTAALFDTRLIGFYPTTAEPVRGFVDRMHAVEAEPGVLSVSLAHGFPWADVADVGTRVLVYADGDAALAQRWSETLGRELYGMRDEMRVRHLATDAALDAATAGNHLSVVADAADNAGGGAPSDNTAILRRLVERRIAPAAVGALYDPGAVAVCFEAGLGARFELRIGGKLGRTSGEPIDLNVTVESLSDRLIQTGLAGHPVSMGRAALVDADGIKILLCSIRVQTFSPDAFERMGLDLDRMRCVVVKSSQHFHAGFAPRAERILYVAGGGALDMAFERLPYTKRDLNYFPRVQDPLGG